MPGCSTLINKWLCTLPLTISQSTPRCILLYPQSKTPCPKRPVCNPESTNWHISQPSAPPPPLYLPLWQNPFLRGPIRRSPPRNVGTGNQGGGREAHLARGQPPPPPIHPNSTTVPQCFPKQVKCLEMLCWCVQFDYPGSFVYSPHQWWLQPTIVTNS